MNIIGICGKAGAGKDTIADYLCKKYANTYTEPFAAPLKLACAAAFGIPIEDFHDPALKESINSMWGVSPRKIAQFVGTEMFRDMVDKFLPLIEKDFWVRRMELLLNGDIETESGAIYDDEDTIIIPDVRFQNEYNMITEHGGHVFVVIKEGLAEVGIEQHESEKGFVGQSDNTWLIDNDGTLEELYAHVENALTHFNIPLFINTLTPRI